MKLTKLLIPIFLFFALLNFTFLGIHFGKPDLIVHEWGTFTSNHLPNGIAKEGIRFEGKTILPEEVYTVAKESFKKKKYGKDEFSNASGFGIGESYGESASYQDIEVKNDFVRMETPVLYFYSPSEKEIEVSVKFPNGSIGEWYPNRSTGEIFSKDYLTVNFLSSNSREEEQVKKSKILDLKNYSGHISWKAKILSEDSKEKYSIQTKANEWLAPRETDSNLVQIGNEIEKYIFYRGIASFESPLKTTYKFKNKDIILNISNSYSEKIPFVFILDNRRIPKFWKFNLDAKQKIEIDFSKESQKFSEESKEEFVTALANAGLYKKEAIAMIKTWSKSYFDSKSVRIFWIVPEKLINELLPIEFSKKPNELKRVFIGRINLSDSPYVR
jgi:hypothetical protein